MRILVFCDEDLRAESGGDRQVIEFVRHLADRHHDIYLIAPHLRQGSVAPDVLAGIRLIFVPVFHVWGLRPLTYMAGSALAILWILIRRRMDVLLWFDSPGQLLPGLCARALACPYVLFVNGLPSEELKGLWGRRPIKRALTAGLRAAAQGAEQVVSICDEILAWMQKAWPIQSLRCHVVRNGVDPVLFRPADAVAARTRLGLDPQRPYVGFVGGFFPWHGLETLIDAIPALLEDVPGVCLLLVGAGQAKPALEARARHLCLGHAVRFAGRVPYVQVPEWIAASDLCVALHRPVRSYPGDSMKLWEYMACARPVVTTVGPGYGDAVEAVGCGVSVKPDDAQGLAQALRDLLLDAPRRAIMGERGRTAVAEAHTWAKRAEQLEAILDVARRPPVRTDAEA